MGHSRQVQPGQVHLLFQGSRCVHCSSAELVCQRKCSYCALTARDEHIPGVGVPVSAAECLLYAVLLMLYTRAASFQLFCQMCLFVAQRIKAFLLLHSSWFKQAHLKGSLTAQIIWKDSRDKQEFACRACDSVHSKQPKIW